MHEERAKWAELESGIYAGDFRELLARCNPRPGYPRPPWSLSADWAIVILGTVTVLGVAVLFAIRARMLSR